MARERGGPERVRGRYAPIPHEVLDSVAYSGCSFPAKALLVEVVRQLNGSNNNGHAQLTMSWLRKRGWNSAGVVQAAKRNLIERGLLFETRRGGLEHASLFAVAWLPITNPVGLDADMVRGFRRGAYSDVGELPHRNPNRTAAARAARADKVAEKGIEKKNASPSNGTVCSVQQNGTVPPNGTGEGPPVPSNGAKTAHFRGTPVPSNGMIEIIAITQRANSKAPEEAFDARGRARRLAPLPS